MKHRNPLVVFILSMITCGIYYLYWLVKTKGEMNRKGEKIPTAFILLIPIIGSIWWYWKYSKGVARITQGEVNGAVAFLLLFLLSYIGAAIVQDSFNAITEGVAAGPAQPTPAPPAPFSGNNPAVPANQTPQPSVAPNSSPAPAAPVQPLPQQTVPPTPPKNPPLVSG